MSEIKTPEEILGKHTGMTFDEDTYLIQTHLEYVIKAMEEFSSQFKEGIKEVSEVKQPNLIDVGNLVIDKLSHDEYWSNPRNRKTRIIVELLMRECYLCGWNGHALSLSKEQGSEAVDVLKWLIEQRESEDPIGLFDGGFYQESDQEGEYEIKPFRILELFKEEKGL